MAEVALDIHGAAVSFDEAACDRESQSGAGGTILLGTSPRLVPAERAFEDLGQVFRARRSKRQHERHSSSNELQAVNPQISNAL